MSILLACLALVCAQSDTGLCIQEECMHGFLQLSSSINFTNESPSKESLIEAKSRHRDSETASSIPLMVPLLLIALACNFLLHFACGWGAKKSLSGHLDAISAEAEKAPEKLGQTFVDEIFSKASGKEKNAPALKAWSEALGIEQTMTFEELAYAVQHAANLLVEFGVVRGDRVAFFCKGTLDFFLTFLGAQCVGATPVLLNWRQSKQNLQGMMEDCAVSWLVVGALHEARADILEVIPASVKAALLLDGELPKGVSVVAHPLLLSDTRERERAILRSTKLTRSDEAAIFFTSGSTSRPKPVLHTYGTLMWAAENYVFPRGTTQTLAFLPNFHVIMTSHNFLIPLARGICVAVHAADDKRPLLASMLLKAVADLKPQVVDTVPFIMGEWSAMSQQEVKPLSQCAVVQSGGAPLSEPVARALLEHGVPVREQYGQTEAGGIQLATVPGAQPNEMMVMMPPWKMATVLLDGGDEGELIIQGIQSSAEGNLSNGELVPGSSKLEAAGHRTGDVFRWTTTSGGQRGIVHSMRTDDTTLLSTGEMFNPVPIEKTISDFANGLDELKGAQIAVLGKNRASPILVVEAPKSCGLSAETVLQKLKPAIDAANSAEVEYARVKPFYMCVLSPDTDGMLLPKTAKGNFIRSQSEKQLSEVLDKVEAQAAEKQTLQQLEKAKAAGFDSIDEWLTSTGGAADDLQIDSLGIAVQGSQNMTVINRIADNAKALMIVTVLYVHYYLAYEIPILATWGDKVMRTIEFNAKVVSSSDNVVGWASPAMSIFFFAFGVVDGMQDGPARTLSFFSSRTGAIVVFLLLYKFTRVFILWGQELTYYVDGSDARFPVNAWFIYVMLAYRALVRVLQALGLGPRMQVILIGATSMEFAFNSADTVYDSFAPWPARLLVDYSAGLAPCNWISSHMAYIHVAEPIGSGFCLFDVSGGEDFNITEPFGKIVIWLRCLEFFAIWHIVAYYYGEDMLLSLQHQTGNMLKWMEEQSGYAANRVQVILSACCLLSALVMTWHLPSLKYTPQICIYFGQMLYVTLMAFLCFVASTAWPSHMNRIGSSSLGIYIFHRYCPLFMCGWVTRVSNWMAMHWNTENPATCALQLLLLLGWPIILTYALGPTMQWMCITPMTWIRELNEHWAKRIGASFTSVRNPDEKQISKGNELLQS